MLSPVEDYTPMSPAETSKGMINADSSKKIHERQVIEVDEENEITVERSQSKMFSFATSRDTH